MGKYDELNIEKDFWDDFILEAFEHIDEIESNAMNLDKNPDDMDIIHTMFRAFHTIKGLSGFVEHTVIQEIAHKTETMMDYCRKGDLSVNTKIVDAILKSSDYIKQLCENVEAYKDASLISEIEGLLDVLEDLANIPAPDTTENKESTVEEESQKIPETEDETTAEYDKEAGLMAFVEDFEEVEIQTITTENNEEPEEISIEDAEATKEEEVEIEIEVKVEKTLTEEFFEEVSDEEPSKFEENESQFVFETKTQTEEKTEQPEEKAPEVIPVDPELKAFQKDVMAKLKTSSQPPKEEVSKDVSAIKTASANEEYMKVANYKIDHLVDMMGELIINQALIEQYVTSNYSEDKELTTNMSGFLRITRELQNLSMSLRMVSLKSTFQKITRIARDTIQELKKDVEFITSGDSTEIDRVVADKLLDPLVHLIKNAISHGVEETREDRIAAGKSPRAKVELNAYSKRGKIFIEVKDDGRGINTEIVYQKALEKELIDPNRTYSEAEIKEFIMLPGFSTAKIVDNISGRGVGMDVVKTQIMKTGGKVDIQSTLAQGSTFTLEVPVNNAIMNGTIIEINDQQFVVPTINVKEFLKPNEDQWVFTKTKRTMIKVREHIIPIVPISTFFKGVKEPTNIPLVMIVELDQELRAVPIVNVLTRQEVVVKPVSEEFAHLKFISGMSILGTGKVSLILDIDYLFRKEVTE